MQEPGPGVRLNGEGPDSGAPEALSEEYIREAVHFVVNWHAATVNMRLYPPTSHMVTETVESARGHLENLFESREQFSVSILENSLLVEDVRLEEVEQQKAPVRSFVEWMNERMLTHLEFKKGVTPEELLTVFEVLAAASDKDNRENIAEQLAEQDITNVTINQRVYVAITAGEEYADGIRKASPLDALKDELLMRYLMGKIDLGQVQDKELVDVLSDPQKVGGLLSTFISVEGSEGGVLVRSQKAEEALNALTEMVVHVEDEDLRQMLTEQIGAIISEMSPREMTSMLTGESPESLNIRHVRERVVTMLSDNQLLGMVDSLIDEYMDMKSESDELENEWTKEKLRNLNELLVEVREERGESISEVIDQKLEVAGIEEERDPGTGRRVLSAYQLLGGPLEEKFVELYGDIDQEVSEQVRRLYTMEEDDLASGMLITLADNLKQESASVRRFAAELVLETLEGLEREYQLMASEVLENVLVEDIQAELDYAAYVPQVDSVAVIARRYMQEGMTDRASGIVDLLKEQTSPELAKGPELVKHASAVVEMLTGPEGLIDMRALLLEDDEKKRLNTVQALSSLGPNALLPLVDLVKDRGQVDLRERAIEALQSTGEVGVEAILGELSKKNPWYVCRNILNIIADLKLKQAIGPVGEMVNNPDERIRREAVRSLARIGERQSIPVIQAAASDPSAAVRRTAVRVLGMFGDESIAPFLLDMINGQGPRGKEEEQAVMEAACLALGDLHDTKYIPQLTDLLGKGGLFKKARPDEIRAAACMALGAIGDDSVIPVLDRAMKDPSMMVRSSAEKAMRKLGGGIAAPEPLGFEDVAQPGVTPAAVTQKGPDQYRPPPHREAEVISPATTPDTPPQPEIIYEPMTPEEPAEAEWPPYEEEPAAQAPEAVEPYSLDVLQPPQEAPAGGTLELEAEPSESELQPYQETTFEEPPASLEEVVSGETIEPVEAYEGQDTIDSWAPAYEEAPPVPTYEVEEPAAAAQEVQPYEGEPVPEERAVDSIELGEALESDEAVWVEKPIQPEAPEPEMKTSPELFEQEKPAAEAWPEFPPGQQEEEPLPEEAKAPPRVPAPPEWVEMPVPSQPETRPGEEWSAEEQVGELEQAQPDEAAAGPEAPPPSVEPVQPEPHAEAPDVTPLVDVTPLEEPQELPPIPLEELFLEKEGATEKLEPPREEDKELEEYGPATTLEGLIKRRRHWRKKLPPSRQRPKRLNGESPYRRGRAPLARDKKLNSPLNGGCPARKWSR